MQNERHRREKKPHPLDVFLSPRPPPRPPRQILDSSSSTLGRQRLSVGGGVGGVFNNFMPGTKSIRMLYPFFMSFANQQYPSSGQPPLLFGCLHSCYRPLIYLWALLFFIGHQAKNRGTCCADPNFRFTYSELRSHSLFLL